MNDTIERLAEAIHKEHPVTSEGHFLCWTDLVRRHPERAREYREAALNRIKAEEAMKRLNDETESKE